MEIIVTLGVIVGLMLLVGMIRSAIFMIIIAAVATVYYPHLPPKVKKDLDKQMVRFEKKMKRAVDAFMKED